MSPDTSTAARGRQENVGLRLTDQAKRVPDHPALVEAREHGASQRYSVTSFQELDRISDVLAAGLLSAGAQPGTRLALLVRPGRDFVALVYAMFKAGIVCVLIDPGMGRRNLVRCLAEADVEGFVAIPAVQAARLFLRRHFPRSRIHVTAGRRWWWGGPTVRQMLQREHSAPSVTAGGDDPAAIIFTTGSTGPSKGVLYRHSNFAHQADELQQFYDIQPGEVDVACFPLFALFNGALGVTTVIPDMDATRPADVDPQNITQPIRDWKATQAFGSPSLWHRVGRSLSDQTAPWSSMKRVLSAGAPVPWHVLESIKRVLPEDGEMHTPYGATEALPVASISAGEVLGETAAKTRTGAGTCVGRAFPRIEWRVVEISDGPAEHVDELESVAAGEIGELLVRGPVVTREYVTRTEANALHKVRDGDGFWHRMGDVGYLDETGRFWFCGRKSHRVTTREGTLFTVPCEAIVNEHPQVYRSALVGLGKPGSQRPVVVVETWPDQRPAGRLERRRLVGDVARRLADTARTREIRDVLWKRQLPVDIRHNAKIFRERLRPWAARRLTDDTEKRPQEPPDL